MAKIALIEDQKADMDRLRSLLKRYEKEEGENLDIYCYSDAVQFLEKYTPTFDVIFLDIEMPYLDGLSAAKKIRIIDSKVTLIFTTNLSQYATEGYEVEAFDYILKPIQYTAFCMKFRRVMKKLSLDEKKYIIVTSKRQNMRVPVSTIYYLEAVGHNVIYYTSNQDIKVRDKISDIEQRIEKYSFVRINSGCVINLKYVEKVVGDIVTIHGREMSVSRSRKNAFNEKFAAYIGEKN